MMELEEYDALTRIDFYTFVQRAFQVLMPRASFKPGRHLELICAELEAVRTGRETHLILNQPPRNLKSIIASVAWPAFILGHNPGASVIVVSCNLDLASKFGRLRLKLMESDFYARLFPETILDPSHARADSFETLEGGGCKAGTALRGPIGFGADFLVVDDPMEPQQAWSDHVRQKLNLELERSVLTRHKGLGSQRVVVVQQRLHHDDTTGHLLRRPGWRHLSLAAIAEKDECYDFQTPFGSDVYERKAGEVLNPAFESLESVLAYRDRTDPGQYRAAYQGDPVGAGDLVFKVDSIVRVRSEDWPTHFEYRAQSWDTSFLEGASNSYSVCTTWGVVGDKLYLLDTHRARHDIDALRAAALSLCANWKPHCIIIEAQASGWPLLQQLRNHPDMTGVRLEGVRPVGSKLQRAAAQTDLLHGRRVHVPLDALWWPDLERELALFPHVAFKDQVDSIAQALAWLREPANRGSWWGVAAADREGRSSGKVRMQAPSDVNCLLGQDGFPIPIVDQVAEVPQSMVYGLEQSRWRRL